MLEHRKANEEVSCGELVISDDERHVDQREGTGEVSEADFLRDPRAGECETLCFGGVPQRNW